MYIIIQNNTCKYRFALIYVSIHCYVCTVATEKFLEDWNIVLIVIGIFALVIEAATSAILGTVLIFRRNFGIGMLVCGTTHTRLQVNLNFFELKNRGMVRKFGDKIPQRF